MEVWIRDVSCAIIRTLVFLVFVLSAECPLPQHIVVVVILPPTLRLSLLINMEIEINEARDPTSLTMWGLFAGVSIAHATARHEKRLKTSANCIQ